MVLNFSKVSDGKNVIRANRYKTGLKLADFVTQTSLDFFAMLQPNGSLDFLQQDPIEWPQIAEYLTLKEKCRNISVINDAAERALGLAGDLNTFCPATDSEKHQVVLTVAKNRKLQDNSLKHSVINYLQTPKSA